MAHGSSGFMGAERSFSPDTTREPAVSSSAFSIIVSSVWFASVFSTLPLFCFVWVEECLFSFSLSLSLSFIVFVIV